MRESFFQSRTHRISAFAVLVIAAFFFVFIPIYTYSTSDNDDAHSYSKTSNTDNEPTPVDISEIYTDEEIEYIEQSDKIRIGLRISGKPLIYTDDSGEVCGINIALSNLINKSCYGLDFDYEIMDANTEIDLSTALSSGEYDAIITFADEDSSLGDNVAITSSITDVNMVMIQTNRNHDGPNTFALKRGFEAGIRHIYETSPESQIVYVDSGKLDDTLEAIVNGQASATYMNTFAADYYLQKPAYRSLHIVSNVYFTQSLCYAVDKDINPILLSILNKAINATTPNDIQSTILENYVGIRYEYTISDYIYMYGRYFIGSIAIIVLLIIIIFLNRRSIKRANSANQAKTEFLSRISHDIRTPIGAIHNLTEFARADIDDKEKLLFDLDRIEISNKLLLSLINDVLDISKIDSGKIQLILSPYSYAEYIGNVQIILSSLCNEKHLNYSINKQEEFNSPTVMADKSRLNQITFNLLSNAVKYTPSGGTITYTSETTKRGQDVTLGFTISDTGIGISKEFQKHMYEDFAQETKNPLRKDTMTGTGLGLSIVKKLIDLMNGTITVQSEIGKGSSFTVRIPLKECVNGEEIKTADDDAKIASKVLSGKVLVAEDNEINIAIIRRVIESFGVKMDHAPDGKQVIKMYENSDVGEYFAILMDIQMPNMNGYDAAAAIRSHSRDDASSIPIIAMTADAFEDALKKAYAVGMNDYITKPLDTLKLKNILAKYSP